MEKIKKQFEKIKKSKNFEEINDFLIEISKNPNKLYITFLEYLIENCEPDIFQRIKLNLVYLIGEIGKSEKLEENLVEYLNKEYKSSDRWVRNEIIIAFKKISKNVKLSDNIIELIGKSLNEDYLPIKINALKFLINFKDLSNSVLKNVFRILNKSDLKLVNYCTDLLQKIILNEDKLFEVLNFEDSYKILNKKGIRKLLMTFFHSINSLKVFKEILTKSTWDREYIEMIVNEIDTYEKIMLKNL